ncbi:MAG TPA: ABC transporter permease [Anaerolineales bacterium]|nr:ABC transporter permease [Anaerolineae bacterium]HIQ02758.1 ABC transporter permease [Anaerolineales bacterium]
MIARTITVARKELLHIVRDRRTMAVMFLIPIVQLFLLGYAATTDIEHLRTTVLDGDRTPQSRELIEAYRASNYFDIVAYVADEDELARMMDRGTVWAGLIIPAGYGADVVSGQTASVAFVIDGSDPNVANAVFAASQQVGQAQSMRIIERRLGISPDEMTALEVRSRVWYNPEMKSVNFMIPGLIAMILFTITIMLTSLAIVREREQGTIEQLMVTPIRPIELVVGKVTPYIAVAFFNVLEVLAIGVYWFGVPIHGSLGLLMALAAVFLMTSLGIGIFISSVTNTQQEAMLTVWMMLLPSIFLAGFFFPLEAMPKFLQAISYFIPLRYMLVIIRGIILKGVGIGPLADQVVPLLLFGVSILIFAATRFRKRLE